MAETRLGPWGPERAQPLQTTPGSAGRRRLETPPSPWLARAPPPQLAAAAARLAEGTLPPLRRQDFVRRRFRRRREEGRGGEGRGWSGREDGGVVGR
jgi:hypothetical protein